MSFLNHYLSNNVVIISSTIPQVVRYAVYELSFFWTKNGGAIVEGHMQLRRSNGDLGPHNVLWKDAKIVIIDWERPLSWFPEYWESGTIRGHMLFMVILTGWWNMFEEMVERV